MSYRIEKTQGGQAIIIDGFEKGIASSPYTGIANIRNMAIAWYPSVAYVNYKRQAATLADGHFFAGIHSTNVSDNFGWQFTIPSTIVMGNPVAKATSPAGLNYVLDDNGNVFKQNSVNSSTFSIIENGGGRQGNGAGGLAYWFNYLIVFGDGMIEFCGDGTGDSGVIAANWNSISSQQTSLTVNPIMWSMSSGNPASPVPFHWTSAPLSTYTSATLNTAWTGATGNYPVLFENAAQDIRTCTFTNLSTTVTWTGGLTNDTSGTAFLMYQFAVVYNSLNGYFPISPPTNGIPVTFTSTGTLPGGITAGTTYYIQQAGLDLTGLTNTFYVSAIESTNFKDAVMLTSSGTGTITMHIVPAIVPPIKNTTITGFYWSDQSANLVPGNGATTLTLTSAWLGANGEYNIVDPNGNNLLGIFVYGSNTVNLVTPALIQANPSGTFLVQVLNPSNAIYKTWNSKVDSNLYFTNGHVIGRIAVGFNSVLQFIPNIPVTYAVNYETVGLTIPQDTVVDMTDLRGQMVILGNYDTYTWDYISTTVTAPNPVGEQTTGMINLLNNVYIFAGQKGNIYVSNGASAQVLYKIPDSLAGIIDPVWSYGGYMFHRGKLYFQATASNTTGTNILAGVFSLNVSATLVTDVETSGAFVMEAQNSYGLAPASGASAVGVLMDNEPSSNGQDSYYSAWSNGNNVGGIDYNSTLLWGNNEPMIETDIIPVGSILESQTLGLIEFKLDRPMTAGDSISLYSRTSLTDAYTLIKTTSTAVLSDYDNSSINTAQWVQFKVTFAAASSGSSFIPLREIRLHVQS